MSQKNNIVYNLLGIPKIYDLFQSLVGAKKSREYIVETYIPKDESLKILDVGCGTGEFLKYIPNMESYLGIDFNEKYIQKAESYYKSSKNVSFSCEDITTDANIGHENYDLILLIGVLHHLNDEDAKELLAKLKGLLSESGFVLSVDPVLHKGQNCISRAFVKNDRGNHVRKSVEYIELYSNFLNIKSNIETNLLRIPYSNFIIKAQ